MELMRHYEVFVPKHHVIFHALKDTAEKGNPWSYSSWLDESLNKTLKAACRNASQITFEETILSKMHELLKGETTCARSRKRAADNCKAVNRA
jgi:hypothetical protein